MFYTLLKKIFNIIDDKINLILIVVLLLLIIVNINIDNREKLVSKINIAGPNLGKETADGINKLVMDSTYTMIDVVKNSTRDSVNTLIDSSLGRGPIADGIAKHPIYEFVSGK